MREINFRAWDKKGKQMFIQDDSTEFLFCGNFFEIGQKGQCKCGHTDFDIIADGRGGGLVLMQFTGLKDRNGKDIYEGDILKITRINWYCPRHPNHNTDVVNQVEVYWNEEENGMFSRTFDFERLKRNPNQEPFSSSGFLGSGWNDERADKNIWEVIGNIYENPELLDAEDNKGEKNDLS